MSRRASAPTRTILPDPRFNSLLLAKFVNMVMERGKKSVAEKIVYGAVDRIAEKTGKASDQSIEVLSLALDNVKPTVEVKSRRVGGATYQVPVEVRAARRRAARSPCRSVSLPSCWTHPRTAERPYVSARTPTVWRRRIAHSPTIVGKDLTCRQAPQLSRVRLPARI
jgi:hypothetical protein